jgi:CheY-like chemotaxis protein
MSSTKTILIAHRHAAVRERFAAALADARHAFVLAGSAEEARRAAADVTAPVSLALVDLGLEPHGAGFVRALREAARRPLPVAVFSGTVASAADIPELSGLDVAGYVNEHAATAQILPALAPLLQPAGEMVILVKPQFEVGKGQVGKGGIVRDPELHKSACQRIEDAVRQMNYTTDIIESPILGAEGNKEFLLYARH